MPQRKVFPPFEIRLARRLELETVQRMLFLHWIEYFQFLTHSIMRQPVIARLFIPVLVFLLATPLFAQQDLIELTRAELQTQKKAIIVEVMQFSETEAEVFWPMYRDYEFERSKLGDQELALIKKYAENFTSMTDEMAGEIMEKAFDIDEELLDLKQDYYKKISKELSKSLAARFIQLENQIGLLIDLKVASELPLLPKLDK